MTAPNLVMIILDDLGFADLGCFGSEIETPAIDGLAADGLRYYNFHVTELCSPTRGCLMAGRNHHAVGMGLIPELASRLVCCPAPDGNVSAAVSVDGQQVASGRFPARAHHLEAIGYYGTLRVGRDHGFPVCDEYRSPFPFTGEIHRLVLSVPATATSGEAAGVGQGAAPQ